jgi:MtN3 and saliva related transmembrane protein
MIYSIDWYDKVMFGVGIGMALLMIPHILRMRKYKTSEGQSLFSVIGFTIGIFMWLLYGIKKNDAILIFANAISFIFAMVYVWTIYYYRYCFKTYILSPPRHCNCRCTIHKDEIDEDKDGEVSTV